jgi:hypothetical protein
MDDARLERLLVKPEWTKPFSERSNARNELRAVVNLNELNGMPLSGDDMLRTRVAPKQPRQRLSELSNRGRPKPAHGTAARYKHHGCRCSRCCVAIRERWAIQTARRLAMAGKDS